MTISETTKSELNVCCQRIVKLLRVKKGSIEIHCFQGEPTEIHVHDKSIKFKSNNTN